ncbi:probable carbohydrate oxidoreductase [Pectobacterium atrosepticum SCRI1043]|uniref:Probable carbohydrate oxidoreductase n=1 Tax=Pectobacterium atrosepticum (strain SCRI 1043 / ATCC BAA-672) TaxID=218491 RepID=Q6D8Q2_PECAS|nr:mannitol dehydrogenase family protein [Pectobacterium atrosepticum]GKV86096.1 D-mannonate oxidoreductase [Pectobacterium carotovorum subsp. carotovorum]AIA69813.1 D-mannonate oxidoreductase [Pectobacterium atrosepticum]AIK12724.1 D-mannonate oxidoreductase [Pectobacterium atrosepticum]ATY89732.1 mannitol dehydrogenase family protein [Pectobacterium atrosepticum]KFX11889.1 D-mannonate oxidoreductase [Pectobacterium atrosepticum]
MSINKFSTLKPQVVVPRYDRSQLKTRIAHIGFGAFHRAHQAVCADKLAAEQGSDWGYCEINLIGGEQQIEAIRQQDLLWSVSEMADSGWNSRVIGVATTALHAEVEGIEAVLEALSAPDIAIVSITVTEKGYCHHPATGQLNIEHPLICHDLALPAEPRSLPGVILAAIKRRRERQLPAFSVMSCDNMPENGHVTRNVIVQLAEQQDVGLARWIEQHVTFPSTMVDRIVPAITDETLETIQGQLGVADPAGVACEPFFQWVIEDNFVNGRPAWEKTGAELVQDVLPFEEMKLRMLNGSHSFLAYLGYLAGYQHISECMQDSALVAAAHHLMLREQAPTLRTQGVDLAAYAGALLDRYRNRALKHRTWQIAMDGSQKLPQRMLDSIRWHLANGSRFDALALGVAGWMRYVGGVDEQGQPIEISDPLKETIAETVQNSMEGESRVVALLALTAIFGEDLPQNPAFVEAVTQHYLSLLVNGVKGTLQAADW